MRKLLAPLLIAMFLSISGQAHAAWTTLTGIDLRCTSAYVTDPAGNVGLPQAVGGSCTISPYSGTGTNSPLSVNSNSFSAGWSNSGISTDGARDGSTGVDHRLAGMQFPDVSGTFYNFQVQMGTAAGSYKLWLGISDQRNNGFPAGTITISDANGTLTTVTCSSQTGLQVCDATGTIYATATAWAAATGGAGNSVTVTSTDTSNGNGGPQLKLTFSANMPLSYLGMQFTGGGASAPPPQPSPFAIGASLLPRGVNLASFAHN